MQIRRLLELIFERLEVDVFGASLYLKDEENQYEVAKNIISRTSEGTNTIGYG